MKTITEQARQAVKKMTPVKSISYLLGVIATLDCQLTASMESIDMLPGMPDDSHTPTPERRCINCYNWVGEYFVDVTRNRDAVICSECFPGVVAEWLEHDDLDNQETYVFYKQN